MEIPMRIKINLLFLTIALLFLSIATFCQNKKSDESILISPGKSTFYSDETNLLTVHSISDKYKTKNLITKCSQGRLVNPDEVVNGLYLFDSLTNGQVTILVYINYNNQLKLLNKKVFTVTNRPLTNNEIALQQLTIKPILSLNGWSYYKIPIDTIKKATRIEINKPYRILSADVFISGGCENPALVTLKSGNFGQDLLNVMKYIRPKTSIDFDELKFMDSTGNTFKISKFFEVTENGKAN